MPRIMESLRAALRDTAFRMMVNSLICSRTCSFMTCFVYSALLLETLLFVPI